LQALLQAFVEDEQLGPDDAWYCRNCKECVEAWKRLEFHVTPPILVLQLKRFQYTRWSRERLNTPVHFPLEGLDLSSFATATSRNVPDPPVMVYDLAGMSKHIGSLGGGHYVAYCRSSEDGEWYNFDDGCVRRVSVEEVEADKVGQLLMAKACYDVRQASAFWLGMEARALAKDERSPPEFLSTHPANETRVAILDEAMAHALKEREC